MTLSIGLFASSDPLRKEASAALSRLRAQKDDPSRLAAARDGFDRALSTSHEPDAARVRAMVCAAAGASSDVASTARVYEAGLQALAAGVSAGSGFLAGLAFQLMRAGYRTQTSANRTAIGAAALRALASDAPCEALKRQAELIQRVGVSAKYFDSAIPAMESALRRVRFADSVIGRVVAHIVPQAFSLRALAHRMAKKGLTNQAVDDGLRMAREGLTCLAAGGDAVSAMAVEAVGGMKFSNTSRDAALAALSMRALPLRDWFRSEAPSSTTAISGAGAAMMKRAWAGRDGGNWVDEKTGVGRTALAHIAAHGADPSEKALAAEVGAAIAESSFTSSAEAVASIAFDVLSSGRLCDRRVARMFARMTRRAVAGNASGGAYEDDKSVVARHGAAFLARHGKSEETRRWADLLSTVLAPPKFTETNAALAHAGFRAIASGRSASDAHVADVLRTMVTAALNSDNARGSFQADKSAVVNAASPWLEKNLTRLESQKLLRLWVAAVEDTTFALSDEKVSKLALKAIAGGDASDRALASLASRMTKAAHAGTTSSYAYKDDKTGVALRAARFLSKEATRLNTREWADFLLASLDRITFTQTAAEVSQVAFAAMRAGRATDERQVAACARKMVKASLSSYTSSSTWADDRSVVAGNAAAWLSARPVSPATALLSSMTREAIRESNYSPSAEKAAYAGFGAIASGASSRAAVALAATRMIKGGAVDVRKQDQGPIAVAVTRALAHDETKFDRSRLALEAVAGMMDTDADYRERVTVARAALTRWAEADPSVAQDPYDWVRSLPEHAKDDVARVRMLAGGVGILAADKGGKILEEAQAEISGARGASDARAAYSSLQQFMSFMERRPSEKEKVERMVEVINHGPGAQAPKVEMEDEYVVIGGVRVQKRS